MPEIERALRDKARFKLRAGVLPLTKPSRTWGGAGAGLKCAVCEMIIGEDQMELEVQFLVQAAAAPVVYHLHLSCFAAWEFERGLQNRASA